MENETENYPANEKLSWDSLDLVVADQSESEDCSVLDRFHF